MTLCETDVQINSNHLGNHESIESKRITSSPDDDVAVAVAGEDVTVLIEGHARDVPRLVSALKDAHTFVQHAAVVQRPEGHVSLAAGHYLVAFQRMPLGANHRVDGALQSTNSHRPVKRLASGADRSGIAIAGGAVPGEMANSPGDITSDTTFVSVTLEPRSPFCQSQIDML